MRIKRASLKQDTRCRMEIIGYTESIAAGETARIYRLTCNCIVEVLVCNSISEAATFSFWCKGISDDIRLRVSAVGPYSKQTKDFNPTTQWKRYELSVANEISLEPLSIYFVGLSDCNEFIDVAIAFPQCEYGLLASPVVPPDVVLPSTSLMTPSLGACSTADIYVLDKDKTGIEIDSTSATIICVATRSHSAAQALDSQFFTFFSTWCSSSGSHISVGVSGAHNSKFAIRETRESQAKFTCTDIVASNDTYFVCAVFDQNCVTLIVNGGIVARLQLSTHYMFDRIYIGSAGGGDKPDSLCGYIREFSLYGSPLLYPRILEIYSESCPERVNHSYDYMRQYFRYALTDDSEVATFNACLENESFSLFLRKLEFAMPILCEQFPPGGTFTEENVRDTSYHLMLTDDARMTREDYSKIGRTDLILEHKLTNLYLGNRPSPGQKKFRIEFKIWGRHGYNALPSQPLKYMVESELAAAIVIIDRRQKASHEDLGNIISACYDYECTSIKRIPLMDNMAAPYFVSFHKDPRFTMLRMIISIYLWIPSAKTQSASP